MFRLIRQPSCLSGWVAAVSAAGVEAERAVEEAHHLPQGFGSLAGVVAVELVAGAELRLPEVLHLSDLGPEMNG
jgi:hypothetical protein